MTEFDTLKNLQTVGSADDTNGALGRLAVREFVLSLALAFGLILLSAFPAEAQTQDPITAKSTESAEEQEKEKDSVPVEEPFVPDFEDHDFDGSEERAWEYRPYQVAVWFCLDGSPALNAIYPQLSADVTRRSELLDASGWDLTTGKAPTKWRYRFLRHIETLAKCEGFAALESLKSYDKLMIVCLQNDFGKTLVRVREFDIKTRQWGPLLVRDVAQKHQLGLNVMNAISIAFMPIAKIDRVQEYTYIDDQGKERVKDEVVMQVRAIECCTQTRLNERLKWEVRPIKGSPVFIDSDDRFLPVIRRTDRLGNLVGLEPLEFTFLTVNPSEEQLSAADKENESEESLGQNNVDENVVFKDLHLLNSILKTSIESYHRAPLSQRKSKRAQKFALVIRPPERSTTLFLYSSDKAKTAMEGFEIWSRRPGSTRDEKSEYLGKTDWRGSFEIPPSPDGLRLIYVKRGSRALKKLPIMPGLYDFVETTLPNDETRLFAQGVIQGFQNEILSLVIRRDVLEGDIDRALKDKNLSLAKTTLNELQDLESPKEFKDRMSIDEGQLKTLTADAKELDYINRSFDTLKKLLNDQAKKSRELEFLDTIQKQSRAATSPASSGN